MKSTSSTTIKLAPLATSGELLESRDQVVFLDGSWHLDKSRDAQEEFVEKHIAGARRFDIDDVADTSSDLPHMMPSPERFAECMRGLGISRPEQPVCIYVTSKDCFSAARVWWTFRAFQHENVCILQGGLPAWEAAGGPVESGEPEALTAEKAYPVPSVPSFVTDADKMLQLSNGIVAGEENAQILDARGAARFKGEAPEPRPGLSSGRIPGSVNFPYKLLLADGDLTTFKSVAEMKDAFMAANVDLSKPIYTTCGSGVSAAILGFGIYLCKQGKGTDSQGLGSTLYDGSWSEWGSRADLPGKY